MLQVGRDLPAILSQLSHDLLGQPDIHGRRIVGVPGVVEFLSQLLARDKLLTKSKTFIKSTIECRQSSFSFFCAASLVSTASTSTFEALEPSCGWLGGAAAAVVAGFPVGAAGLRHGRRWPT